MVYFWWTYVNIEPGNRVWRVRTSYDESTNPGGSRPPFGHLA
jgi:hypothetical protein